MSILADLFLECDYRHLRSPAAHRHAAPARSGTAQDHQPPGPRRVLKGARARKSHRVRDRTSTGRAGALWSRALGWATSARSPAAHRHVALCSTFAPAPGSGARIPAREAPNHDDVPDGRLTDCRGSPREPLERARPTGAATASRATSARTPACRALLDVRARGRLSRSGFPAREARNHDDVPDGRPTPARLCSGLHKGLVHPGELPLQGQLTPGCKRSIAAARRGGTARRAAC